MRFSVPVGLVLIVLKLINSGLPSQLAIPEWLRPANVPVQASPYASTSAPIASLSAEPSVSFHRTYSPAPAPYYRLNTQIRRDDDDTGHRRAMAQIEAAGARRRAEMSRIAAAGARHRAAMARIEASGARHRAEMAQIEASGARHRAEMARTEAQGARNAAAASAQSRYRAADNYATSRAADARAASNRSAQRAADARRYRY